MEREGLKLNTSKERWQILRKFITNRSLNVQHKRTHAFGLFKSRQIRDVKETNIKSDRCLNGIQVDYEWIEYFCEVFPCGRLGVRQRVRSVNWTDVTGFDNTGNICVWPSEEILSYLCIKNAEDFSNKTVCELGAGMTGLAGMMLAVASDVQEVLVTDGNIDGVSTSSQEMKRRFTKYMTPTNSKFPSDRYIVFDKVEPIAWNYDLDHNKDLKEIMEVNKGQFRETKVNARQLRWDVLDDYKDIENSFDYVLCADCLLYEDVHDKLLEVMRAILKHDGMVMIVSPQRGSSFQHFIEKAQKYFLCKSIENYDEFVWSNYNKEKELHSFEAIRNFPILIEMRKTHD